MAFKIDYLHIPGPKHQPLHVYVILDYLLTQQK